MFDIKKSMTVEQLKRELESHKMDEMVSVIFHKNSNKSPINIKPKTIEKKYPSKNTPTMQFKPLSKDDIKRLLEKNKCKG